MNMYYLAILAPDDINKEALKWKNFFKEKYRTVVSLRSPAHITLIPPFWMKADLEKNIIDCINEFCKTSESFNIQLKNFSAFAPKTVFIDVLKSDKLEKIHSSLKNFIQSQNKFPITDNKRVFHPHITLATRDLRKKDFHEAWEIFLEKKYEANWTATGISLLRHNKKNWDVIYTSQFSI